MYTENEDYSCVYNNDGDYTHIVLIIFFIFIAGALYVNNNFICFVIVNTIAYMIYRQEV